MKRTATNIDSGNWDTVSDLKSTPSYVKLKGVIGNSKTVSSANRMIRIRNQLLEMLIQTLSVTEDLLDKFLRFIEDPLKWCLYFFESEVHPYTVVLVLRLLVIILLLRPTVLSKFRSSNGFVILKNSLLPHWNLVQVYESLFGLFFGIDMARIPLESPQEENSISKHLDEPNSNPTIVCPEAFKIILTLAKRGVDTLVFSHQKLLKEDEVSFDVLQTPISQLPTIRSGIVSMIMSGTGAFGAPELIENKKPTGKQVSDANPQDLNEWTHTNSEIINGVLLLERFILDIITERYKTGIFMEYVLKSDFLEDFTSISFPVLFSELEYQKKGAPDSINLLPSGPILKEEKEGNEEKKLELRFNEIFAYPLGRFHFDFLLVVAKDLIFTSTVSKMAPNVDLVFDSAFATDVSIMNSFITKMLNVLVVELKGFIGDKQPRGDIPSFLRDQKSFSSILKFSNIAFEKVLQGSYVGGADILFDFLAEVLEMVNLEEPPTERLTSGLMRLARSNLATREDNTLALMKLFNRILLYQLEESHNNSERKMMFATRIIYYQKVILGSANTDLEFFRSICCYLYQYLYDTNQDVQIISMNIWKLVILSKQQELESLFKTKNKTINVVALIEGFKHLIHSETGIVAFQEFLKQKKNELDLIFDENFSKSWNNLKNQETKNKQEAKNLLNQKRTSKTKRLQKEEQLEQELMIKTSTSSQLRYSKLVDKESLKFSLSEKDTIRQLSKNNEIWEKLDLSFQLEVSIWGGMEDPYLQRWKLDLHEGPSRMRLKLERNHQFYTRYPFCPEDLERDTDYLPPSSFYTPEYLQKIGKEKSVLNSPAIGPGLLTSMNFSSLQDLNKASIITLANSAIIKQDESIKGEKEEDSQNHSQNHIPGQKDELENKNHEENTPNEIDRDNESILERDEDTENDNELDTAKYPGAEDEFISVSKHDQFLSQFLPHYQVFEIHNCVRVSGLDIYEGILVVTPNVLFFIDHYYQKSKDEIVPVVEIPREKREYAQLAEKNIKSVSSTTSNLVHSFVWKEIRDIYKRRFLLRNVALELFMRDGEGCLIAFHHLKTRDSIYNRCLNRAKANPVAEAITGTVRGEVIHTSKFPSSLSLGEITTKWERREITNFEYLMQLNTRAGRTYNDLTQYPVFPWILRDYTSEEIDLSNPEVYRELDKPMGAQTNERLQGYIERYNEMEDDPSSPKFFYGTHYSSSMTVCLYLLRLEPFTQEYLELQGNHFDRPDRLFHSIPDAWESASQTVPLDVRELIPEFFYLPEFLKNTNRFDFGKKDNHILIDNVVLPPWAKGDPDLFIRIQKQALESEYVSQNLHNWIDLIFGYKQTGKPAEEAYNVFHHLSYEGKVDIDKITDPIEKTSTIGIINNFGQTPTQLFKKPHQKRQPLEDSEIILSPLTTSNEMATNLGISLTSSTHSYLPTDVSSSLSFVDSPFVQVQHPNHSLVPSFHLTSEKLIQSIAPVKEIGAPVGYICWMGDKIAAFSPNQRPFPGHSNRYVEWGFKDESLRFISSDSRTFSIFESLHLGQITTTAFALNDRLVTGGEDGLVLVWKIPGKIRQELKLLQNLSGHLEPITTISVSNNFSIIVSASKDCTCIIWDLTSLQYLRTLTGFDKPVTQIVVNEKNGDIAMCSGNWLYLWTLNGVLLAKVQTNTSKKGSILSLCFYESQGTEGELLFTSHANSKIRIWSLLHDKDKNEEHLHFDYSRNQLGNTQSESNWILKPLHCLDYLGDRDFQPEGNNRPKSPQLTSIVLVHDQKRLYVGDSSGCVYAYSFPDSDEKHWVKDAMVDSCPVCSIKFNVRERKHHCRSCGGIFCANCSKYEADIPDSVSVPRPVKQCQDCYNATTKK